jgi:hypothetical protein
MARRKVQRWRFLTAFLFISIASASHAAECKQDPKVQYDGLTFSVSFCPTDCGAEVCYAGVTLRRAKDAFQFDFPAQKLNQSDLGKPVRFSEKVGPGFVEYRTAVWAKKESCDRTGRHGCVTYGYLLDFDNGSDFGYHDQFDKIARPRIKLMDAGGGPSAIQRTKEALSTRTPIENATISDGGKANRQRDYIEILYRNAWERPKAWEMAKILRGASVGIRWEVTHWPESTDDFVIALGETPKGE